MATPGLMDPNFFRAVVLLCRYNPERGAVGLVLNRPTDLKVGKVIPQIAEGREERLWVGGPVDGRSLWVVHRRPDLPERGDEILEGVWFGAHPQMIRRLLRTTAPDKEGGIFRLFVGYAGWAKGQLEGEMEEGAWKVVPAGPETLVSGSPESLWGEMLLRSLLPCSTDPDLIRDAWMN